MTQEELNQKLIAACNDNDLELVEDLIEKGADINIKDDDNCTPLHYACFYKNLEMTKFLVEKGADVNAKEDDGHTPLDIAKRKKRQEIIQYLEKLIN